METLRRRLGLSVELSLRSKRLNLADFGLEFLAQRGVPEPLGRIQLGTFSVVAQCRLVLYMCWIIWCSGILSL